ncbi:MAG: NAD(P)/FAD-dependent oxidoreductase [Pseudomonadales bacterium]|jgi:cation diffusion facilitator CzcD-associated flavoprotein CzcO|nr:NAD(P)/FAD-dependent oxidoreductase [Pseudomonadales bacterium]
MGDSKAARDIRVVVMGAGMAGILSGIKLLEAGITNCAIYEKAGRVGGTWRENTYPGLTCDVPSHAYTYSFEPNPDWSHMLPPGAEIQEYFERTTRKYGVDRLIRFNEEIVRCEFRGGRWHLETKNGTRDEADIVIAATGVLHHPNYPDIPGLASFGGACFHTARWDHGVPLDGRRIGVIGNGSTGVQIISALATRAGRLHHFQRTAQWIMPVENPEFTEEQRAAFRADPALLHYMQNQPDYLANVERFNNSLVNADSQGIAEIEATCLANLENSVRDPVLRERLRPHYRAACKRLIYSPDYYEAIQHPNAELVSDGIECLEPRGVRLKNGRLVELDVLALATGFNAGMFMRPMNVVGRNGVQLNDAWADRPKAYMAIAMPDFPNFFMLNGPNGPVGNFSLIDIAEQQLHYIWTFIEKLRAGECREVAPTQEAMQAFERDRIAAAKHTVFGSGCRSWYLDAEGIPATWPWTRTRFCEEMKAPRLDAYELAT